MSVSPSSMPTSPIQKPLSDFDNIAIWDDEFLRMQKTGRLKAMRSESAPMDKTVTGEKLSKGQKLEKKDSKDDKKKGKEDKKKDDKKKKKEEKEEKKEEKIKTRSSEIIGHRRTKTDSEVDKSINRSQSAKVIPKQKKTLKSFFGSEKDKEKYKHEQIMRYQLQSKENKFFRPPPKRRWSHRLQNGALVSGKKRPASFSLVLSPQLVASLNERIQTWVPQENGHPKSNNRFRQPFLISVFHKLEFQDLLSVSRVCRDWHEASNMKVLWNDLIANHGMQILNDKYEDVNIWEDPGVPPPDKPDTRAAVDPGQISLNQLVARLTPNASLPNTMDFGVFLTMYKTFTTPGKLVLKLIQRYHVPSGPSPERDAWWSREVKKPIQLRVVRFLLLLIDEHYSDLNSEVLNLLKIFIRSDPSEPLTSALKKALQKKILEKPRIARPSIPPIYVKNPKKKTQLMELNSKVIAEQLCHVEFDFFKEIEAKEWIEMNSKNKPEKMDKMIEHFNDICRWVMQTLLDIPGYKERAKIFSKFIRISQYLREMDNFETLNAIINSLRDPCIFRLNATKGEVDKKHTRMLDELHELMNPDKGYTNYRQALLAAKTGNGPCIPYLGVYRRDLIYHFEVERTSDREGNKIDFKRKTLVYNLVMEIQHFQKEPYKFAVDPQMNAVLLTLAKLPEGMTDDSYKATVLFEKSLKLEPRNSTKADLQP